jgi:hypothetical protein
MVKRLGPKPTHGSQHVPSLSRLAGMTIAVTMIAALGAAGCGSSSKSSSKSTTTSTPAITKADFLAKANAICKKGNKLNDAAASKLGKSPSKAQITAFVKSTNVPSIQAQITAVRALGAPSGDKATVTKFLDLAQADLNKIKSNPALVAGKTNQFANFAKIAHPYGLKACAKNS